MTKADERSPLTNALEANLLETAAEVVIPDRYAPLLEAARPHFGLHQDLEALLKEYFHPFRNVGLLLEGLSRQTLGRWFQYRTKPDAPQYFGLFCELLWELLPTAKERDTREEIVRVLFAFWGDALAGPRGEEYEPSVCEYRRQIPGELIPSTLLIRRDTQLL